MLTNLIELFNIFNVYFLYSISVLLVLLIIFHVKVVEFKEDEVVFTYPFRLGILGQKKIEYSTFKSIKYVRGTGIAASSVIKFQLPYPADSLKWINLFKEGLLTTYINSDDKQKLKTFIKSKGVKYEEKDWTVPPRNTQPL